MLNLIIKISIIILTKNQRIVPNKLDETTVLKDISPCNKGLNSWLLNSLSKCRSREASNILKVFNLLLIIKELE
jgi:hypothetical protein